MAMCFACWATKLPHPRAFALNDESLVNMAYAAYKKTHDVGVRIARAFYDRAPAKIYFYGGSEGGREALMMAQRFPTDFDGIVSVVPVANYTGGNLMRANLAQLQREGGWISPAKVKVIQNAVNSACDKLDGLDDGIISAYEKCLSTFDVGTLLGYRNWIGRERGHAEACHKLHQERRDFADVAAGKLQLASRHLKVMERLRDRAWRRHLDAERQQETKELDQLATLQYARRKAQGADREY